MTTKETYEYVLEHAAGLELATETLAGHTPNVRTVFFVYFPEESENTIYFTTARETNKVKEITANANVSFTTAPIEAGTVRVTGAKAKRVNDKKPEIFAALDKKCDSFKHLDQVARDDMNAYALTYSEAEVFSDGTEHLHF
ncbi:hypothetical protein GM612_03710 [Lactobacillus sp. CRM56-3]|uniref:Pyridoxamine 5'-phosphate oxidase N-terminal domain-containing protein n=1 Tax=Secundilactobacillus folii TaxID=2678357 RepID=A0A7X2XUC2_9LACO|nr:hypothetical protein [Secundilactobacillus folii]